MNREEARQALIEGRKVTHVTFTQNEYLELTPWNQIYTEDGYHFGDIFETRENMDNGWSIWKPIAVNGLIEVIVVPTHTGGFTKDDFNEMSDNEKLSYFGTHIQKITESEYDSGIDGHWIFPVKDYDSTQPIEMEG